MAARRPLSAFWRDQSGATAVEVGVIVVLISIALISAITMLSDGIKTAFTKSADAMGS
ncbi:Flp family type IVb pilin [Caulobacter sp. SL161]|uniref:Flp family type IVb pilin n=1 Tax=Caulobacter sp. SL161 TaxID=2995156 RepID=UPI00227643DA|nr:Flp family type IVb pilin [Caulobacter sp. SL161]MCY1646857.1 Flp family type IVb pilin [Caulobacter sp. SL161]